MITKLHELKEIYEEVFRKINVNSVIPEIEVNFYPYIGINHTIRVRNGKVYVRLAEICIDLPLEAQKALAFILVSKLLNKRSSPQINQTYRSFINNQEFRHRAIESKRKRGRKIIGSARGEYYDLSEIFSHLNQIYFDNKIAEPTLSWSARRTYRILGHHDSTHETIVISKSLDDKSVPKFVVEFIVFHEMLHIFHPTEHRGGRRYNHTPQFRRDEKTFAYFNEAEIWIDENIKHLKKKAIDQYSIAKRKLLKSEKTQN